MARTKGAKNIEKRINTVEPSRCINAQCGSTAREDYDGKTVIDIGGEHDGKPYTRVVYRPTRCLDCGQTRTDRTFEYEPLPRDSE